MSLFIIATIVDRKNNRWDTLGYKVLNTKTGEYKLLSDTSIKKANLKIENAEFVDHELKATMGDFKRYTKLNAFDGRAINGRSMVILGKDSEGYFLCVDYPDAEDRLIKKMSPAELKRQIKFCGGTEDGVKVANARVDNPTDVKTMIVRPIKGNFEVIEQCPKYIEKEFDFGQSQGKYSSKWKVRLIKKGMPFGNNSSRINDGKSVLEFYDISGDKDKFPSGQYVCSYYMETIMEHKGLLKLYADVEPWTITGPNMIKIQNWAFDIS